MNNLKFVQTVIIDLESGSQVFFIDPSEEKVFDKDLKEAPEDFFSFFFSKINSDQLEGDLAPIELYDVLDTERKLSEDNDKHIFRRN
jgi:hypothetical protein